MPKSLPSPITLPKPAGNGRVADANGISAVQQPPSSSARRERAVVPEHVVVALGDRDRGALEEVLLPALRLPAAAAALLLLLLLRVVLLRQDLHDRLAPPAKRREGGGQEVVAERLALVSGVSANAKVTEVY